MADKSGTPGADNVASASPAATTGSNAGSGASTGTAPKKPQNPAFRMMGLPRLRLPSRNWMIFLSITGGFTGAVVYDKWQTKRMREKWCQLVSPIANEPLDTKTTPRKVTIYLSAPPGDGLRGAREHFHNYIKPILVAAAMDWDVVEGRKEGDVRHKTAERIRKRRKRNGEGAPVPLDEQEELTVESIREKNGDVDYPGVAGDIVVGRNTWKEYIRGIHEGYLGPPDLPKELEAQVPSETSQATDNPNPSSVGDAEVTAVTGFAQEPPSTVPDSAGNDGSPPSPEQQSAEGDDATKTAEEKKDETPKRRFPPPSILPDEYQAATLSPSTPDIIGPSAGVRYPHLLGIRNTPTRIYRFLNRRTLQDDIGRQVATAILSYHRPYSTVTAAAHEDTSSEHTSVPEQNAVLAYEERDWWKKTVQRERQSHEESVWIEPMAMDERIASRMRVFELTAEDQDRAKRIGAGLEKPAQQDLNGE